jgi:hypothetical protein
MKTKYKVGNIIGVTIPELSDLNMVVISVSNEGYKIVPFTNNDISIIQFKDENELRLKKLRL